MPHDATKMLLGASRSSDKDVTCENADPASFPAGRAVRGKSDGTISLASGDGKLIGVSMGKSLSDHKKTAVARAGNLIPIEIAAYLTKGSLTFVKKVTAVVNIAFITGGTAGSEVVAVTGDADAGYLISVSMDGGVSTATQMKTALDLSAPALALIETHIASGAGGTAQAAFASDEIDAVAQPVIGAAVYVSNVTGKAMPALYGAITGASYASGALDGISPDDGTTLYKVALIDMAGGL